jgi:hypothetical protein
VAAVIVIFWNVAAVFLMLALLLVNQVVQGAGRALSVRKLLTSLVLCILVPETCSVQRFSLGVNMGELNHLKKSKYGLDFSYCLDCCSLIALKSAVRWLIFRGLGRDMIKNMVKDGKIVPSEVTVRLLLKAMEKSKGEKFLIDGFPRNDENRAVFERMVPLLLLHS